MGHDTYRLPATVIDMFTASLFVPIPKEPIGRHLDLIERSSTNALKGPRRPSTGTNPRMRPLALLAGSSSRLPPVIRSGLVVEDGAAAEGHAEGCDAGMHWAQITR